MQVPPPYKLSFRPRRLFLFSGHMVDASNRAEPRFPASMLPAAQARIDSALEELDCCAADMGLTQGASGGDVMFAETCLKRAAAVHLLLPQPEDGFIRDSLLSSVDGERWRDRFLALKDSLASEPGTLPEGPGDIYERCNLWLVETAFAAKAREVILLALWNGANGSAGGTAHMVSEAKERGGRVVWIDTRELA